MRLAAVLIALLLLPAAGSTAQTMPQFRAYWVDSFGPGLYTPEEIDRLVADARAANLNAVVVQVGRRADCLCNRSVMPRTEAGVADSPFDPLQTLIDKAHAAGLEVHAWLNATIMWGLDRPPADPGHAFNLHGPSRVGQDNWVAVRADGAVRGANNWFFDLGHPDAVDYIVGMYLSVLREYDVDGINLDYIRYPDHNLGVNVPSWGYNPVAVQRFRAATGRTDVPVPQDAEWMAWRREQVTNLLRRIYLEAYAAKPHVRVSANTITYGRVPPEGWTAARSYREVLQDWRGWMEEGILDLNIPMNYRRESNAPESVAGPRAFDEWTAFAAQHQYARQAVIGTGLYLNPVEDNIAQARRALVLAGPGVQGWVGFSYRTPDRTVDERRRTPDEGRQQLAAALREIFPGAARTPEMPWKVAPRTGHLLVWVRHTGGRGADQVQVTVSDAVTGAEVAARRTDGSGWTGVVDLPPGDYVVAAGGVSVVETVVAGRVARPLLILPP